MSSKIGRTVGKGWSKQALMVTFRRETVSMLYGATRATSYYPCACSKDDG
jgi:hypothetical protein